MTDKSAWVSYILGAGLTLLWKWGLAVYHGRRLGKTVKEISCEWFFESSRANTSSWVATIGGVWLAGSIYIDHVVDITGLTSLPVADSFAFCLGSAMEFTVPAIFKWITAKLPGGP